MTQLDSANLGEKGNTTPRFRTRRYSITYNNYDNKILTQILKYFELKKYKYIIGKEIAPTTGTKHLQIYLECKSQIWNTSLLKFTDKWHIEKAKGNRDSNLIYCSKDNNFETNFKSPILFPKIINNKIIEDEYKNVNWKPWQMNVLDILKSKPNNRTIHVFVDPIGNVGKSYLCKYIAITFHDVIICDGKKDNIFNQVKTTMDSCIVPRIILLDVPRSNRDFINYGVIEQLKNGLIYSGKYEGGKCIFPIPHVLIFTNEIVDLNKMSRDRWIIHNIKE